MLTSISSWLQTQTRYSCRGSKQCLRRRTRSRHRTSHSCRRSWRVTARSCESWSNTGLQDIIIVSLGRCCGTWVRASSESTCLIMLVLVWMDDVDFGILRKDRKINTSFTLNLLLFCNFDKTG